PPPTPSTPFPYTTLFRSLHPSSDAAYQARKVKWDETLREIRKQPMGHGLGTANQLQEQQGRFVSIGSFSIDNSYLRVGYEQGIRSEEHTSELQSQSNLVC